MPFITLGASSELQIKVPTNSTTSWGDTMRTDTFQKIAEHDHTGSGKGKQLGAGSIANDSITGTKFRLNNNESLRSRNAADSANINILKINTSDKLELQTLISVINLDNNIGLNANVASGSSSVSLIKLNASDKIELGAEIATSLDLSNNIGLQGRDAANSSYLPLIKLNASDKAELGTEIGTVLKLSNNVALQHRNAANSAYISTIKLNASDRIELGAALEAFKIKNDTYLTSVDNAGTVSVNILKVNTSDEVEMINASSIELAILKSRKTANLNDNQVAATTTGISLSSNEACRIHYKIIRNTDLESGTLDFDQSNAVLNRMARGDDCGITFSVSSGVLNYQSTSTGNAAVLSYIIIKE